MSRGSARPLELLRVTLLTPSNFGGAEGDAAVDRPVARAAWSGLPYLPFSTLKGVLAARWGSHGLGSSPASEKRHLLFGSAASDGATGNPQPAQIVLGDGELLAFPLATRAGVPIFVLPATSLYRLHLLHGSPVVDFASFAQDDRACMSTLSRSELPLRRLPVRSFPPGASCLSLLRGLCGIGPHGHLLVAGPEAARQLWELAVERRSLTALGDGKRVRARSLRRVERIPSGTLFVSHVTCNRPLSEIVLSDRPIQIGAWESVGNGFARVEPIELSDPEPSAVPEAGLAPPSPAAASSPRAEHEILREAYRACRNLADTAPAQAVLVRSILRDLGARWRRRGLEPTLAFLLAKAQPARGGPEGHERRQAHRWVLARLIGIDQRDLARRLAPLVAGVEKPPDDLVPRLLWYRRLMETMSLEDGEAPIDV